jgi:proteasome lid subunit RPN8/RPN11
MQDIHLTIRKADLETIIRHCRAELPNEACGILGGRCGTVDEVYPMKNGRPSPASFEMVPEEQFRVMQGLRETGRTLVGVYHSHPSAGAVPSVRDVELAYWPETLFPNQPAAVTVIVSLIDRRAPVVKGYAITEAGVEEVPLVIT